MKRDVRRAVAAGLVAAIGFTFVALPATAAREAVSSAAEPRAIAGHGFVHDLVSLLGSWLQALTAPSGGAMDPNGSPPNPGEGAGHESPGFQDQSGGAMDPNG